MSALTERLAEQADKDLQLSRRALSVSQDAWDGPALAVPSASSSVGWFGSDTHRENGAVALVSFDGPLSDLVGDIIRVSRNGAFLREGGFIPGLLPSKELLPRMTLLPGQNTIGKPGRSVLVYVIDRVDTDRDLLISRRAFHRLGLLANESIEARIERLT